MNKPSALGTYLRLLAYLRPHLVPFIVSTLGFLVFAASQPGLAKLMGLITDALNADNPIFSFTVPYFGIELNGPNQILLPLLAVAVYVIRGLGSFLGNYYNAYVSHKIVLALRLDIFNHLTTLPTSYFDAQSAGQVLQRLTGSVQMVSNAASNAVKVIIREGLTVLFLIGYVFYLNWQLSLTFLFVAPCLALTVRYTTRKFRSIAKKSEGVMAKALQSTTEMLAGHETMRAFNAETYEKARYKKSADGAFKLQMKITKVSAIATPVIQLVIAFAIAAIVYMILDPSSLKQHTPGDLISYLAAIALLPKPMRQLSEVNVLIQRGIIAAEIVFQILDAEPEVDNGTYAPEHVNGRICFNHVNFYYADGTKALDDICFTIHPGEKIALVGRSGSGKTTLASLLPRYRNVSEGEITIDGVNINEFKLFNLRKLIALVNQKVILYNDSVKNNIAYGFTEGLSDDAIKLAAKKAHALDFIDNLADGMNTNIGDNGQLLSGGQRQRLAIARVFLKDAPILILDEATSALDNEAEYMIQKAFDEITEGRTTIVIAHRLTTIENADRIFVMDQGKIVAQGSHKELLGNDPLYTSLYNMDFQD